MNDSEDSSKSDLLPMQAMDLLIHQQEKIISVLYDNKIQPEYECFLALLLIAVTNLTNTFGMPKENLLELVAAVSNGRETINIPSEGN